MANGGEDWPAWLLGLGAMIGTAWAVATKGRTKRPEKEQGMQDLTAWRREIDETLSAHQTKLERFEQDRREEREDMRLVFKELRALHKGVDTILAKMDPGRNGQ